MRLPTAMAVVVVGLAGSCGGGGRSLADLAEGDWTCAYHQTADPAAGAFGPDVDARVTATITADTDSRGSFELKLAAGTGGQAAAVDGDWRLSGRDLRVAITRDVFGGGGTLDYRGVAQDARRIEVRGGPSEPFKPVAVTRHGGSYEFRWDPFDATHARMTCHRS